MPYGCVLIVDDVETNIFVARGLMTPYGLRIDSANSGFSTLDLVKGGNTYDIIFMDHMMPGMDGIETTKALREAGYNRPIVALTANAVAGQADLFLSNGFDDYISKPIDIRQLNAVLNKLIRDKQTSKTIAEARQQAKNKNVQTAENAPEPVLDSQFAEFFIRDAVKALTILEVISEKEDYANDNSMRSYIINVHGLKSALANIKKMDLSNVALKLESAGREGNLNVIMSDTPAFLDSLRALIKELKPEKETVTGEVNEDTTLLKSRLLTIKAACDEYDETTADEVLVELRKLFWSPGTSELLGTIAEQLLHSDFDEISNGINEFLETKKI
jgi:CheY-like chemotaxis protein/HPt (histidine-containing phosphotransfer) domain-containing protein